MRELRFRAWNTDANAMLQPGDEYGTTHPLDCCVYKMQGQAVILMQYTGLKDKNGKEIYEGDIVDKQFENYPPQRIPVEWVDDLYDDNGYFYSGWNLPARYEVGYENKVTVIGNRFENPELLEGE